jgi:acetyl-CoA acetyltransferase
MSARSDATRDAAAVIGIGMSEFSANSGRSELDLAAEVALAACADAGVDPRQVDGFATYSAYGEGVTPVAVANFLGNPEPPNVLMNPPFGGNMSAMLLQFATMAVVTGAADYMLLYKAFNGRSGSRMGGTGTGAARAAGDRQWDLAFGIHGTPLGFAFDAAEYIHRYAPRPEDVGELAVTFRDHAQLNPHARMYGKPITVHDYLSSRFIIEPLRLLDCCVEIDGAAAVLVTTSERARELVPKPVLIRAVAYGYRGLSVGVPRHKPGWQGSAAVTAPRLYSRGGLGPEEVDIALLCDDYTYSVLPQIEEFGWCGAGEAAAFAAAGQLRIGGTIPCNTNGGQLSEGFLHGFNQVIEAIIQLRGDAGTRQVPGANVALVTGTNGASGALLRRNA